MAKTEATVECIIPVLAVSDLQRSVRFYTEALGFRLEWGGKDGESIGSVTLGGRSIMLSQGPGRSAGMVWIGLEDDALFAHFRAKATKVTQEPQNHPWAYDMKVEDPDGNVLWLATEPKRLLRE
jgi:catechol 2,3-dioxygenase-like lactoylglutathione lyase family enzyme